MRPTSALRITRLRQEGRTALLVALLATAVYLPGFSWGAPVATHADLTTSWAVDDETPLGPLAEIHNILDPKPDRNLGYPLMHPLLVAAAYAPYMAYLVASGEMKSPEPHYPFGLANPVRALRTLSGIAHLVSVLMGVTAVVAAFFAGWWYRDRPTGLLAAALAMTTFPMLYYARTGNVDMTMLAFIGLGVATYCWCLRNRFTVRAAIWLGAWTGCAIATKEAAFGVFALMPVVLLPHAPDRRTRWRAGIAGLGSSILAFGLGSGLFIEPGRYIAHVQFIAGRVETVATDPQWVVEAFPYTLAGHAGLARLQLGYLADALTFPGLCLVLASVVWIVGWQRRHLPLLVPAIGYAVYMFVIVRTSQLRYVLPLAYLLAPAAALAVRAAWQGGRATRALGTGVAVIAIGVNVLRGLDLTYAMLRDSRYAAGAWLADRLAPGDRVEYFGPNQKLPPLESGVASSVATPYYGMFVPTPLDDATAEAIARGWEARRPAYVLVIPDLTSRGRDHNISMPPQLYRAMMTGQVSYTLDTLFQTPALLPWVRRPALDYPTVNPPIRVFAPRPRPPEGGG